MSVFMKYGFCVCLLIPAVALAQVDESRIWSGEVKLGASKSTGNTDMQRFNGTFELQRNTDAWRHNLKLDGLYARSNGEERARRYSFFGQTDFKVRPRDYAFNKTRYEVNKFSSFEYDATTSFGYGRRLLQTRAHRIDTEIGVGYRQTEPIATGEATGEAFLLLSADYRWQIQPGSFLTHNMWAEINENQTNARSLSRLSVRVNSRVDLSLSYDVRYLSEVPEWRENVDTVTAANLGFRF